MNILLTCLFYSPIIPHAIPIALFATVWVYWVWKIMFLRFNKRPDMFSSYMATFFANLMPYAGLMWAISFAFFTERLKHTILDQKTTIFAPGSGYLDKGDLMRHEGTFATFVVVLFAALCIICPCRLIIQACCVTEGDRELATPYSKMSTSFPTDYDRENPLTKKEGNKRIIEN